MKEFLEKKSKECKLFVNYDSSFEASVVGVLLLYDSVSMDIARVIIWMCEIGILIPE